MKADIHYRAFGDFDDFEITVPPSQDEHEMLEAAFAGLNRGSGQELPELNNRRSLSVGDYVTLYLDGAPQTWKCAPLGWAKLDRPWGVPA